MEFENYLARTFGPKAKPRDEKEEMSLEDSLDEFTDISDANAGAQRMLVRLRGCRCIAGLPPFVVSVPSVRKGAFG